jgi:hypothetical protein
MPNPWGDDWEAEMRRLNEQKLTAPGFP